MVQNLPQREEYLRKKRNKKLLKYVITIFLVLIIIGLTSYLSHRTEVRISKVELSGGVLVGYSEVESKSLSYLEGSYLWLFPKNNALWYSRKSLENYLKEEFKRIDTINISRKDLQTIAVNITERKPFAIWCDNILGDMRPNENVTNHEVSEMRPSESDGSTEASTPKCYFIDQNSTVFAPAPNFSGGAYFKYYGLITANDPLGKEYIASTTKFLEISQFVNVAKKLSIKPLYIVAKNDHEFSLVLYGGGEILFDTQEPLDKVAENLEVLLKTKEFSVLTTDYLKVNYIDLRFGNKLFYKLLVQ